MSQGLGKMPDMCMMCNGASRDEVLFDLHGCLARDGWAIQYVNGKSVMTSWAYTVGLAAHFDHPELVIAGVGPNLAARSLNGIGDMISAGGRFSTKDCFDHGDGLHTHLSKVHPVHFTRDVFAIWVEYHRALGPPLPKAEALEVVLPYRRAKFDKPTPWPR